MPFARSATASGVGMASVGSRLIVVTVFQMAICECVALWGIVLFLLGGHTFDFYLLAAAAVALMVLHFPRLDRWQTWVQQLETKPRAGQEEES